MEVSTLVDGHRGRRDRHFGDPRLCPRLVGRFCPIGGWNSRRRRGLPSCAPNALPLIREVPYLGAFHRRELRTGRDGEFRAGLHPGADLVSLCSLPLFLLGRATLRHRRLGCGPGLPVRRAAGRAAGGGGLHRLRPSSWDRSRWRWWPKAARRRCSRICRTASRRDPVGRAGLGAERATSSLVRDLRGTPTPSDATTRPAPPATTGPRRARSPRPPT